MRLLMYRDLEGSHPGALVDGRVIDLHGLSVANGGERLPRTLLELIAMEDGLRQARALVDAAQPAGKFVHPLSAVRVLAPLDPPRENVLAIGRNYQEHAAEQARTQGIEPEKPTVFTKAQTSITGPYDDIGVDQHITSRVDWEAELGVVIGRGGVNIRKDDALDHVVAYTVINDVSARDIQYGWGGQFFKGKSFDGFCPSGPYIVTADEVPDPQDLHIMLRLNGTTKQDASTRDMIFSVAELIAHLSIGMTLQPGNLIATGTPAGVGNARKPQEWLRPGDVMETEIEGIGLMRNRIVRAP